jgi:CYTH domain-containing protein
MPTENERKMVLNIDLAEETVKKVARTQYEIHQGYLMASKGMSLRLRNSLNKNDKQRFYMTYKCSSTAGRVVEIEKKIDKRDFDDLWPQCMNKLLKTRYEVLHCRELWEIDFFRDHNDQNYFVMAEVEMPEGQENPRTFPKIIIDNLIYKVALTDCRFASKLLADTRYTKDLYLSLTQGENALRVRA